MSRHLRLELDAASESPGGCVSHVWCAEQRVRVPISAPVETRPHLAHVIKGLEQGGDPAGPTLTARALERLRGQRDSEGLLRGMALLALMPEGRPCMSQGWWSPLGGGSRRDRLSPGAWGWGVAPTRLPVWPTGLRCDPCGLSHRVRWNCPGSDRRDTAGGHSGGQTQGRAWGPASWRGAWESPSRPAPGAVGLQAWGARIENRCPRGAEARHVTPPAGTRGSGAASSRDSCPPMAGVGCRGPRLAEARRLLWGVGRDPRAASTGGVHPPGSQTWTAMLTGA